MNQTDPTAPIRKSSLPSTPPPEWEFHTWFPHPDGGGDMVPGERQRGILVRRCVTWGDWEPVRPDRWADEPETDAAAASAVVSPPTDRAELPAPAAVLAECDTIEADYRDQRDDVAVGARAAVMRIRARAVLPAPADRAAVLTDAERTMLTYALDLAGDQMASRGDEFTDEDRAAMEALRRLAVEAHDTGTQQPSDEDVVEAHRLALSEALHLGNGAPWDAILDRAGELSRRDVDAQQPETEAQPPYHRWYTEQLDPVANQWAPGWRFTDRAEAVDRYRVLSEHGTPAERRLVRETTTYTVEEPAPAAQQPAAEARLARYQTCGVCGAGYETGSKCGTCEFNARMAAEQQPAAADGEDVIAPHCDGFPTACPNPVPVPPAPPYHDGGFRCGCYDTP